MVVNIDKFIDESEAGTLAGGFAVATVSWSPEVAPDISGPPSAGLLPASQIATQDHANSTTSGLKFEFTVPESYDSGPLRLQAVYAMDSSFAGSVVLDVGAEIADSTGGGVDTATYAQSPMAIVTPTNTDVTRSPTLLTIVEGDFDVGDKVVFLIERLGSDGADTHTGVWKLIDYMVVFKAQVAPRVATHQVEVISNTGGTPAVAGTKDSFNTLDFQEGPTQEQKFQWTVPDNWDGVSDFHIRFTYAMSSAGGGNVRFDFGGDVTSVLSGAISPLPFGVFLIPTFADTNPHRSTVVYSVSGLGRTAGDTVALVFSRPSGDAFDTHSGDFQLIAATVSTGQGGSTAASTQIDEHYLAHRNFRIISGSGVNAEQESADYATQFELWSLMSSTVAAGRVDVEWQGRLRSTQTKITSVIIPIRGQSGGPTPQYQIKVFVEGSGATNVYTGSALTPETTGGRVLISFTDADFSAQPTGERRFFVVVEAHLDAGEELRVGTPYVRQE